MPTIAGSNILLTGGAGFIGSNLVKELYSSGANLTILDNFSSGKKKYIKPFRKLRIINGNINDPKVVGKAVKNQDYIVHLAALPFIPDSYYFPKEFFDVNVDGTISLAMAAAKEKIKRFVHISSSEVYGSAVKVPMNEDHPTLPHSTYAVSKLAAERVAFTIHKEHELPVVIIRPFNTYGPNITQPYIIPEIATQLLYGEGTVKLGNTNSKRDLTFVRDTAKGIISALVADGIEGETINIGSNKSVSIEELVYKMANIMRRRVKIVHDIERIRPYDVQVLDCDNHKAEKLLNWRPTVSLDEGLRLTIQWIKENRITFKASFKGWSKSYRQERNLRMKNNGHT